MGRSYRNRVAGFIHRMSENPEEMDKYKSNPSALPSANLNEAKLRTFAVDPMATRTGMPMSPLGDHVMHTMPTAARKVSYRISSDYIIRFL